MHVGTLDSARADVLFVCARAGSAKSGVQPALHDAHVGVEYSKSAAISDSQEADAAKPPWNLIAGAIHVAVLGNVSGRTVEVSLVCESWSRQHQLQLPKL